MGGLDPVGAPDFLVLGTPSWEVVALVTEPPPEDPGPLREALPLIREAEAVVEGVGGSAAVTAGHLARLGHSVALLGAVGDDEAGRRVARFLARHGVRLVPPPRRGRATKRTVVLVHRETRRTAFFADLPERMAPPPALSEVPDHLRSGSTWVHMDRLSPLAEAILGGPHRGASLDLHDPPRRPTALARWRRLLPRLDLVQVRRAALEEFSTRLGNLSGRRTCESSPEDLTRLLARHGPLTVMTDGERGAWWCDPAGGSGAIPASPVDPFMDPTGAGDAFAAAFLDGLLRGLPPDRAGLVAAAAAARACTRLGPWAGNAGEP